MPGPLDGVRVIDLTHALNGPFSTMILAHLGAEVIKVELGDGDRFRYFWMPEEADHDAYEFLVVNMNKKGVTLDLKKERGKELFLGLVERSDVVVENFSVGVMDRLGLGYDVLRAVNPRIIYASSKGYGEDGPNAHVRAYADTIMAVTGWTSVSWEFSEAPGTITQGIGDEASGVSLALGMLAALYARERTGVGQRIDVSMQEALLGFMVGNFHTLFEGQPIGGPPEQCADGYVAFYLPEMSDAVWEEFAATMGHREALSDPRFTSEALRQEHYAEWSELVTGWVRATTRQELTEVFRATGIAAAPVLTLAEVLEDEHLRQREAFVEVVDRRAGPVTVLKPWIRLSETPAEIVRSAPEVGEHNAEVYGSVLGLSEDDVAALKAEGII